ncbi:MAG: hypothetical protein AseanaTS_15550 [Candidatus Pelagadaptatus aseana]
MTNIAKDCGFPGTPGAIKRQHQTLLAGIAANAISEATCERRVAEKVFLRV